MVVMTRHFNNEDGARWILAVSDLHRNKKQMDWVSEQSFDLLLLGGDLLDHGEGRIDVSDWIRAIDRPVAIASGNHDVMKEGPDWLYDLRGPGRVIDEIGCLQGFPICALPWQYDDGDWIDKSAHRCRQAARMRKPWVLLAHHIPLTRIRERKNESVFSTSNRNLPSPSPGTFTICRPFRADG